MTPHINNNNSNDLGSSLSYYMDSMESEFDAILKNFEYLTNKALTFNVFESNKEDNGNIDSHASPTLSECTSEESMDSSSISNFFLFDEQDPVTPSMNNEMSDDKHTQVANTSSMTIIKKNDTTKSKLVDNKRKADHNNSTTPIAKKKSRSVKIPLPSLDFIGQATDKKMKDIRDDTSVVRDADAVSKFLRSFQEYIKNSNTDWYTSLKSCFETRPYKLYPWFQKHIHQDHTWLDAKSMILKTFGYLSPRVDYALVVCIGKKQNSVPNQTFKEYFETYGRAARGYQYIDINAYDEGPDYFTNQSLISKFIEGALYPMVSTLMYTFLQRLYNTKRDNNTLPLSEKEHCSNGKKFTDVPESWLEFEKMIEKEMDFLLLCEKNAKEEEEKEERREDEQQRQQEVEKKRQEEEEKRQQEAQEKKVRREERRRRGSFDRQDVKKETQVAISRMNPNVISARKRIGVCCFCGVKKHSFSHTLVCPEKQRLVQQG